MMMLIRTHDGDKKSSVIKLVSMKQDPWKDEAHHYFKDADEDESKGLIDGYECSSVLELDSNEAEMFKDAEI